MSAETLGSFGQRLREGARARCTRAGAEGEDDHGLSSTRTSTESCRPRIPVSVLDKPCSSSFSLRVRVSRVSLSSRSSGLARRWSRQRMSAGFVASAGGSAGVRRVPLVARPKHS